MPARTVKIARVVFVVAAVVATALALDPHHQPIWVAPDDIEHAIGAWLLMSLGAIAFPRVNLALLAVIFIALGGGVELVQWAAGSDAELGDIAADAVGVAFATAGLLAGGFRRRSPIPAE